MKTEQLEYGVARYKTPLYIYDIDSLSKEVMRFRENLGDKISLCFAMKANPFLTEQMAEIVDRIEICSMGEFQICKEIQIRPEKMLISGVMKKKEDIWQILDYCRGNCIYTIESLNQLYCFAEWSEAHREMLHVYLRLTSGNQFGMSEQTIQKIINMKDLYSYIKIDGIHYFSGTQKRSLDIIRKELCYLDEFIKKLELERQYEIKELEYGPGIPVPYFKGKEEKIFQNEGIREVSELISQMEWKGHVTLEMGRAFTAMCGYYLTEIRDLKKTDDTNYCIVDGGCHQMNYDGQIKGMYHPNMRVIPKKADGEVNKWTVCGALCTVNDVLCRNVLLEDIEVGSVLVFERAGAYSSTEGMALFLSHDLPKVVLYSEKMGWKLVRKNQPTYKWNMSREVEDGYID